MKQVTKKLLLMAMTILLVFAVGKDDAQAASSAKVTSATFKIVGGGDFVKDESKATVSFKVNGKANVVVNIIDASNKTVYKKSYSKCSANKVYSFTWNGKKSTGKYVAAGRYHVKVVSGKSSKTSSNLYFYTKTGFAAGCGSKTNPYKVASIEQFKLVARFNGRYFIQTKDLNYNGKVLTQLFNADAPFTGTYNGNKKKITDITLTGSDDSVGLFRAIGTKGTVKNLTIENCVYSGHSNVGIIAGNNAGTVKSCKVTKCTLSSTGDYAGCIVGNNTGKIDSCVSKSNILNGFRSIAAICGWSQVGGYITNSTSTNDTISASSYHKAGIAGYNQGTITDCTTTDDVIGGTDCAGGIAGRNDSIIKDCVVYDENSGITSGYRCGGIFGGGPTSGMAANCTYYGSLNQIGEIGGQW